MITDLASGTLTHPGAGNIAGVLLTIFMVWCLSPSKKPPDDDDKDKK